MSIKLLAIDLDGTLLRSDHTPHSEAISQLHAAEQAGIKVVIASGRSIQSIRKVLGHFWDVDTAVATNGADVWASRSESLHQTLLGQDVKTAAISFALQNDLHLSCYSTDGTYALKESVFLDEYRELVAGLKVDLKSPEQVMEIPIYKLVFIADAAQVPELRLQLSPILTELDADLTESAPRYLEILPAGVNKGSGLAHLCQHFNIKPSELAAIGDYRNDLEMLQMAGVRGAVSNALPEVKSLAGITVSSNEEGGVGEFIARYVLQR